MLYPPLCEIEAIIPCAANTTHPVRIGFYDWDYFIVFYNPCDEKIDVFSEVAPCHKYLDNADWYMSDEFIPGRLRIIAELEKLGAEMVPYLIKGLKDKSDIVRRASFDALQRILTL